VPPQVAALLARGGQGGGLAMAVASAPWPGAAARLVVVEMDGGSLLAGHPGGRLGVEIAVYAMAADGRVLASRHDGVAVDLGPGGVLPASGLRYLARLDAAEGASSLRVFARVHRTGAFGVRNLALPSPGAGAPAGPPRTWLDALAPGLTAGDLAPLQAAGPLPTALSGQPVVTARAALPSPAAAPPEPPAPPSLDLVPTIAEYRAAWQLLADGQEAAARDRLLGFETAAVRADPRRGMGLLERADGRLLEDVERASRPALLPVGLLYGELFRAHVAAGHPGLARRAALVAERALLRFGGYPAPAEDAALAAAALDGLAAEYVRIEAPLRATGLLERATELEPRRASRWLALAALAERDWDLAGGARAIGKALALEPANREARLRRARIAAARGERERAAELLDALLAKPQADWVGAVAAEERARLFFAAGRPELAIAPLERALRLAPDEASLAAALAFARERSDARPAALAAASQAFAADRRSRVAPRRRYSEPPIPALLESGATAESASLLRLDDLGAALAAGGRK
jgi:tetratricopeptide (TPR) repeat protein